MDIHLQPSKGSKGRGGDAGGQYWHIYNSATRAGFVYINYIDEPPIGPHASLSIELNKANQGKGIGRVAYRLAAAASQYDTVYLHMRKSNIASRKAAEYASFTVVENPEDRQLTMVWKRQK